MVIDAGRRLDELSTARLIANVAEAVHKAQQGGQALGLVSPLAVIVEPSGRATLDRTSSPSVAYSAPERLRGSAGDRRSDVFALGVILWEALAHDRLFGGATDDEMKAAVLDFAVEFRPPSECNANVPAELDAICKKALARDPADRYQSAKVMAAELAAVLDDAGYPDSDERIGAYLAAEFPGGAQPRAPVISESEPKGKPQPRPGSTTALGLAPVQDAGPKESKGKKKAKATPVRGERAVAPAAESAAAALEITAQVPSLASTSVSMSMPTAAEAAVEPSAATTIPSIVRPAEPTLLEVPPAARAKTPTPPLPEPRLRTPTPPIPSIPKTPPA